MGMAARVGALERLEAGNGRFIASRETGMVHTVSVDLAALGGLQTPFAAVLGCSDARVPVELIYGQDANDLFVVRVAGGVPGSESLGSLHYAMDNLPTVEVVSVLGHSGCGAVTAAVDALINPRGYLKVVGDPPLRGIVDALLAGVRMAHLALGEVHGRGVGRAANYREILRDLAVLANAGVTAAVLGQSLTRPVVYAVCDLGCGAVGHQGGEGWIGHHLPAPRDDDDLAEILLEAARALRPE